MRLVTTLTAAALLAAPLCAQQPPSAPPQPAPPPTAQTFTLQQILSAPYSTSLTPAPAGSLFAWVEHTEGRNNLWVGGPGSPARQLTHNPDDDGQDIDQLTWSPDATAVAYIYGAASGADGKPANPAHLQRPTSLTVVIQPLDAAAPPIVIGEGRAPLYTRDGSSLLYLHDGQIWIAELSQRKQCMLPEGCPTAPANPVTPTHQLVFDRGSASQLTLSPDGSTLAFISRRREDNQPSHTLLALYNLTTHTLTFPAPSTGNDSAPAFSPNGKQLAWLHTLFTGTADYSNPRTSSSPWSIRMLSLPDGKPFPFVEAVKDSPGSVLPHLSAGEPRIYWTHPAEDGAPRVLYFDESSGFLNLLARPFGGTHAGPLDDAIAVGSFEVENANLSADGRTLTWASNNAGTDPLDADRRHLWQIDPSADDLKPTMLTHGVGIETQPALSGDGTALAALVSNAYLPMHPALIAKDGSITPLRPEATPSTYPAAALVTPQQVLFDSTDGLHLHGQLFLPNQPTSAPAPSALAPAVSAPAPDAAPAGTNAAAVKRPAILFFHGGPVRQMLLGYPALDYYSNAYAFNQYLVSQGFIVLSVNYRCGIGYGFDFRQCQGSGPTGAAEYNDVLAAAKYLQSRPDVDPKRIGVWGGSYGGYLTALALARNSDVFAAGVDIHGVHDWNLEDSAFGWKRGSYAQKDTLAEKAFTSSPMADIDHWKSPVLLIHGDNDPTVAYAQTPLLAEALRARHVHVEELIFPDETHDFLLHRDWLAAYTAAADFFQRTLHPEPVK
jgi:dipeptidyl aminopeptidase/acylaminoacyl peptidase